MTAEVADRYLDLLENCLTRDIFLDEQPRAVAWQGWRRWLYGPLTDRLRRKGVFVGAFGTRDREEHRLGRQWPPPRFGETMVGSVRLRNVRDLLTIVIDENVQGDVLEAGVWRGGTGMLMRSGLEVLGVQA